MKTLLLATGNPGKLAELRRMLAPFEIQVVAPADRGLDLDVVEDRDTFVGNATKKAQEFAAASGLPSLSDDSGLEVDALNGAPGVWSARYAGEGATDEANRHKLLEALKGVEDRAARFRCVLVLSSPEGEILFQSDGVCEGEILQEERGTQGFGYDSLFLAAGQTLSMAELGPDAKHAISHRGKAMRALLVWLRTRI
ncbi:MAG: RdgB/HAM1 family non-canonical purine NTP pyrophosphatase [Myxococcota bacterium]